MPVAVNDTAVNGGNANLRLENSALDLFHAGSVCSLATLAAEINAEHDAAENHARKAIDHARAAGEKLLQAKVGVAHGQWLPWLAANCPRLSIRRSQEYMRVAREWPALQAKYADSAHLTIDGALALLAEPTPATGRTLQPFFCGLPAFAPASPAFAPPSSEPPKPDSPVEKINREHQLCQAKALVWFPERESLLSLVTAEEARTIRRHWLIEEAAEAQQDVAQRVEELRGQPDMPRWLQIDSLMRALEKADTAARRVKTWPNEPGETDKGAFFERAKALLSTMETQP